MEMQHAANQVITELITGLIVIDIARLKFQNFQKYNRAIYPKWSYQTCNY